MQERKIAIVHDWLTVFTGAERVLDKILFLYPKAEIFCLFDVMPIKHRQFLNGRSVNTSFMQHLPFIRQKYREYLILMPLAIEQLDLSKYDLVISSSHAVAKGVLIGPDQLHISYIHTPIRYAWEMQHEYLRQAHLEHGLLSWITRLLLHYIRIWDLRSINSVDVVLANSHFVARRIRKTYSRNAEVVYPPVDIDQFPLSIKKEDFYLTVSRLVPYKRVDITIEAFRGMPARQLFVIGEGPESQALQANAPANVTFLGYQPVEKLCSWMQRAKAFIFAGQEDFGIVLVEAQACGTPVIAYGKGGQRESIRGVEDPNPTGIFFFEQTSEAIRVCVDQFEQNIGIFSPQNCRENAMRFSSEIFLTRFQEIVEREWDRFYRQPISYVR